MAWRQPNAGAHARIRRPPRGGLAGYDDDGELCSLIATHCLLGHADGENYVRELIETAKRAPRRETTRRKRIFFIHTLPNCRIP